MSRARLNFVVGYRQCQLVALTHTQARWCAGAALHLCGFCACVHLRNLPRVCVITKPIESMLVSNFLANLRLSHVFWRFGGSEKFIDNAHCPLKLIYGDAIIRAWFKLNCCLCQWIYDSCCVLTF